MPRPTTSDACWCSARTDRDRQACEFDYSGSQACKALRSEGVEVVLVNSNPATIMTDPELADRTYVEPLRPDIVEAIIARERPDPAADRGGQTALNLAMALAKSGALERYGVELIGRRHGHRRGGDRLKFRDAMREIGVGVPRAGRRAVARRGVVAGQGTGSVHHRPSFIWRRGQRHRVQRRGVPGDRTARPGMTPCTRCSSRNRSSGGRNTSWR